MLWYRVYSYYRTLLNSRYNVRHDKVHFHSVLSSSKSADLSERIVNGLVTKFTKPKVLRVLDCFEKFQKGEIIDRVLNFDIKTELDKAHNRQQANCWIEGLTPITFHDIHNGKFPWAVALEKKWHIVQEELINYLKTTSVNLTPDSQSWLTARNDGAGQAYGPQWKTLGLQDRGAWDGENVKDFPRTIKLLQDLQVPSCEVFFASQDAHSGIKPHSDLNNFILTSHLAIQTQPDKAWIRVGDETRYWENGKVLAFDTSIFHSTQNDADNNRYVLMIRFWHPDLTQEESEGLQ